MLLSVTSGAYRIAGYFRGANISRLAVVVNFVGKREKKFADHCSGWFRMLRARCYNITPTFFRNEYFLVTEIREIFLPRK